MPNRDNRAGAEISTLINRGEPEATSIQRVAHEVIPKDRPPPPETGSSGNAQESSSIANQSESPAWPELAGAMKIRTQNAHGEVMGDNQYTRRAESSQNDWNYKGNGKGVKGNMQIRDSVMIIGKVQVGAGQLSERATGMQILTMTNGIIADIEEKQIIPGKKEAYWGTRQGGVEESSGEVRQGGVAESPWATISAWIQDGRGLIVEEISTDQVRIGHRQQESSQKQNAMSTRQQDTYTMSKANVRHPEEFSLQQNQVNGQQKKENARQGNGAESRSRRDLMGAVKAGFGSYFGQSYNCAYRDVRYSRPNYVDYLNQMTCQ